MEFKPWGDFPARMVNSPPESSSPVWNSFERRYGRCYINQTLNDDSFRSVNENDIQSCRYWSFEDEFSRLLSLRNASRSSAEEDDDGSAFGFSPANHQPWNLDRRGFQCQSPNYSSRSSPDYFVADRLPGQNYRTGNNLAALAMSQRGARILQNALERIVGEAEIENILDEVLVNICAMSVNASGNYVVQKLIELSNERQRTRIAISLAYDPDQFFYVCLDMHGTRVVQMLMEVINPCNRSQVVPIANALTGFAVALTKSPNGNHVIQHCLRYFPDRENAKIASELARHCVEVATDKSGCCVLQQCVEHAPPPIQELLVKQIIVNSVELSQDRYGNYVVQHIIYLKMPSVTGRLLRALEGHYTPLSFGKYGSNVVEKCLKQCDESQVCKIINELLDHPRFPMLFVDPFGNYVVQSALEVSKGQTRKALVEKIVWNASMMRSNPYGKKILDWLEKRKLYKP